MIPTSSASGAGVVQVHVANGRPKSAEEWAREITDKILTVGDSAPAPIRDQAIHFRGEIYRCVRDNISLAIQQEREWMTNQIRS